MSSLESTIPLLLGKLSNLENRKNKNATVSENIVRIRQLITQARNAASKVGTGGRGARWDPLNAGCPGRVVCLPRHSWLRLTHKQRKKCGVSMMLPALLIALRWALCSPRLSPVVLCGGQVLLAVSECPRLWFLLLQVKVPMKFNGQSGVQVRSPSDLPDLAAYTSLKFYIQNPEPSSASAPARRQGGPDEGRFVLYLGSKEVGATRRNASSCGRELAC